jgi:hypothetical protein
MASSDAIGASFPETQWSLVRLAKEAGGDAGREALARVLQRYLPALRAPRTR